jgi:hypothetical protein
MAERETPYTELLRTKRKRNSGSLSALQRQLWHGLKIVDVALTEAMQRNDDESLRRWLHLLTQMSGAYSKLVETAELDAKLQAVESFIHDKKTQNQSFR